MSDQTLNLGTNFQADVKNFADGVKQVRELLASLKKEVDGVVKTMAALGGTTGIKGVKNLADSATTASSRTRTLYGDMTELQKALGRTESLSGKYSATLSNLTKGMDKNSLSIKDAEKAMYGTDKVLRTLNRSFSTQLEQAAAGSQSWDNLVSRYSSFSKAADLGTISQKVLRGELKATDKSIKEYIQNVTNGRVTFDKFTESKKKSWPIINQVNKAIDSGAMSWQTAAKQQAIYQATTQKSSGATATLSEKFRDIVGNAKGVNVAYRMMNQAVLDGRMTWQEMLKVQNQWKANEIASKVQRETKVVKDQAKEVSLLSRAFTSLWQSMRTIASYGAASAILYGITRALSSGKTEIIEYDQALKNLQAISGATAAELEIMDSVMQEVARRTKFSTVEIGQAMVLLGQSGFSAAESVSSINAVAMLATGTLSDMTNTADLLTTTIRAYNLQAIEANRVSDIMANAINKSKLTLDKLRIAFNYVGATASQAGLTLEETAASLMMLANNGLRASTMGTGLRQILAKMVAPTAKVKDVLEGVSMSVDSINPGIVGFKQALINLRSVMVDSKGLVDMSKAFEMFGLRGAQAAAVLIRSLGPTGGFHDALDTVYEVGTAAHMASIQQEGLAIKIKNMADRAKSLALAFGDAGLVGAMKLFIDTIRAALGGILAFTDTMGGKLILNLMVVTGLVYGLITALKLLGVHTAITGFMTLLATQGGIAAAVIAKLGVVFGALLSPIFLISAAIAGVGIAINWLVNRIDNIIIKHQKLQAEHQNAANSLELYATAIKGTNGVGHEYESLLERLKQDHPELKKVIDENAFSHLELAKAMEEVAKQEVTKAHLEQVKALDALSKKLQQQKDAFSNVAFFAQGDDSTGAWKNFIEGSEKGKRSLEAFHAEAKSLASSLFDLYGADGIEKAEEALSSVLTMSNLSPDKAKLIYDQVIGSYEDFVARYLEITESATIEHVDMTSKATEILAVSKHIMAEQYEIEKEGLNKKLEEIQKAYEQEVREAEFAAVKKEEIVKKGTADEINYRADSMGKLLDVELNTQKQLISFRQAGSDQAIQIVRDENGKIISANEDRLKTMLNQEKRFQEESPTDSQKLVDLYQRMLDQKLAAVQDFYQRQNSETERAYKIERSIVLASFDNENKAKKDLERINKDYHQRRINLRKEEVSILEGLLKDEVGKYEDAQKRIISLREELFGIEKSREETIDSIRRKNLTEYQKYKADEAKFAETMAEAAKEAELAAMAETSVEQERRLEKSKALYEKAIGLAESLNQEVKDGESIIVSSSDAEKMAIDLVNQAYTGLENTVKRQHELAEAQAVSALLNQSKIKEEIVRVQEELNVLVEKDWVADVKIKLDGVKEVDDLIQKLKSLDGKTTTHTVYVNTIEKSIKQSRWGGFIDGIKKFARGGSLSGYGGGDIVDAKLEPGEYVIRKEAVRNVGVGVLHAMNNLKLGASDILSSIKAKTGGYLMPQVRIQAPQFPRLAYQTGGMVQNSSTQNLGSLNLSINNQEIGKIYAEPDVLNILSKQVQRKNRLRSNK